MPFRGGTAAVRLVALAASAIVLGSCSAGRKPAQPPANPPIVVTAAVLQQTVPISTDFVASTVAQQSVDVKARVQGTLDEVYFKEGTLVHKGQLLFKLQQDKYLSAVQSAQAQLLKANVSLSRAQEREPIDQAKARVEEKQADVVRTNLSVTRLRPLAAAKAVPQKDLDNAIANQAVAKASLDEATAGLNNAIVDQSSSIASAKADISQAQAQLADAKLNLSYTTIDAPVTGMIGFLKVDQGNVVGQTGDEVLDTISTVDPMKAQFAVDEVTYIQLVTARRTPGVRALGRQELQLVLADGSIYPDPGELYTVGRTLDAKTGTIPVQALFPNPRGDLRPGQFARVRVITEERRGAVLVPQTAVIQTQGASTAYVVAPDGTVQQRSLTLGPQYQSYYVVTDGVKPRERVVIQGTQNVRPGEKVTVVPAGR
jgi:membrane fusion protein (multidrug efflux system)